MATSTTKYKVIQMSEAEYNTISNPPYTLTKDGVTYTYSPSDTFYVTPNINVTQAQLNTALATKANSATTYTKTEVDNLISTAIADVSSLIGGAS